MKLHVIKRHLKKYGSAQWWITPKKEVVRQPECKQMHCLNDPERACMFPERIHWTADGFICSCQHAERILTIREPSLRTQYYKEGYGW